MARPVVSVVMVICNVERFLREAIESVLKQTSRDFEFIIHGSSDTRIKLHEIPRCGVAQARRRWIGHIAKAREYLATLKSSAAAWWSDRNPTAGLRIADLHFAAAKFTWEKRRFFCALLAASNAMTFHPVMAVRVMQAMTQWLRINLRAKSPRPT